MIWYFEAIRSKLSESFISWFSICRNFFETPRWLSSDCCDTTILSFVTSVTETKRKIRIFYSFRKKCERESVDEIVQETVNRKMQEICMNLLVQNPLLLTCHRQVDSSAGFLSTVTVCSKSFIDRFRKAKIVEFNQIKAIFMLRWTTTSWIECILR